MADAPEAFGARAFYHGTPSEETANKILESQELRPGEAEDDPKGYDADASMLPMAGRVYLSPDLPLVLSHVLGAHPSCPPDVLCKRGGRYGYLFVVPGASLGDVLPDEDTVGELLCSKELPWLNEAYATVTDMYWQEFNYITSLIARGEWKAMQEEPEDMEDWEKNMDEEEYVEHYDFNDMLMSCTYPEISVAGKFFLSHANGRTLGRLMDEKLKAVSHRGATPFSQAWRFDKKRVRELTKDGSNFFELAERVV